MAKQYYLPKNDAGKQLWLQNFSNKLGVYKTKYNIQETQITGLATSLTVYTYWLNYLNQYNEYLKKVTQFKNDLRDGADEGTSLTPQPPAFEPAPDPIDPGIFAVRLPLLIPLKAIWLTVLQTGRIWALKARKILRRCQTDR